MLLANTLAPVLIGLAGVALGTFFAQAIATGYVGRRASENKGWRAASISPAISWVG